MGWFKLDLRCATLAICCLSVASASTTAACSDRPLVDCKLLDSLLEICKSIASAQQYCQSYCGICRSTSLHLTSPTTRTSFVQTSPTTTSTTLTSAVTTTVPSKHTTQPQTSTLAIASSSLNTNACHDKEGVDCKFLNRSIGLCTHQTLVKLYCSRYCGFCSSTASLSTTLSTSITSTAASTTISTTTPSATTPATTPSTISITTPKMTTLSTSTTHSTRKQSSTRSMCANKSGVDCKVLNNYIGICNNLHTAQMYCTSYCGLCGSSTTASTKLIHMSTTALLSTTTSTTWSSSTISKSSTTTSTKTIPTSAQTTVISTAKSASPLSTPYQSTTAKCSDTPGVDCMAMNKYIGLCQDPVSAKQYCAKYCGVCLSTPRISTTTQSSSLMSLNQSGSSVGNSSSATQCTASTSLPSSTAKESVVSTTMIISQQSTIRLTSSSCADKKGIDCKMLDINIGLCKEPVSSKSYCQKYCGFCRSSSSGASSQVFHSSSSILTSSKQTTIPNTSTTKPTTVVSSAATTLQACANKQGVDCHQLDTFLNICKDPGSARTYCSNYCGVCGSPPIRPAASASTITQAQVSNTQSSASQSSPSTTMTKRQTTASTAGTTLTSGSSSVKTTSSSAAAKGISSTTMISSSSVTSTSQGTPSAVTVVSSSFASLSSTTASCNNSTVCLNCKGVASPDQCTTIEYCGRHSICFTEQYITVQGYIRHNIGCRDTMQCRPHLIGRSLRTTYTTPHVIATASRHRRHDIVCNECCTGNLCNAAGCKNKGYPEPHGDVCYACALSRYEDSCSSIQVCGRDEACYIRQYKYGVDTLYAMGCLSKTICPVNSLLNLVGRSVHIEPNLPYKWSINRTSRSITLAEHCCDSFLCNNRLPVDGRWSSWSNWGHCSQTCGGIGYRSRTRNCNNPIPVQGGKQCVGIYVEYDRSCSQAPCPNELVCLSCNDAVSPRDCNKVEKCGPHSVCFLEHYVTANGYSVFSSGCMDKLACGNRTSGKRFFFSGRNRICSECCTGNLCNSAGCKLPGYPSGVGPICYACQQQPSPYQCDTIDICQPDEVCSLARLTRTDTVYQSGCANKSACRSDGTYPRCCDTDLCNTEASHIAMTSSTSSQSPLPIVTATSHSTF